MHLLLVLSLSLPLGLLSGSAQAEEQPRNAAVHFSLGVLAAASTFLWGPAKTIYAVLGTAVGGVAYVLTGFNSENAREIIQPAVRGDYVVTPRNLTAEEPIAFVGRDPYRP